MKPPELITDCGWVCTSVVCYYNVGNVISHATSNLMDSRVPYIKLLQ